MSDLIRRSDVIKVLKECYLDELLFEKDVFDGIKAIPTAYDVDAVVKQLEEAKKKNFESYKEAPDTLEIICYGNVVNAYGNAISVVKAGGVE